MHPGPAQQSPESRRHASHGRSSVSPCRSSIVWPSNSKLQPNRVRAASEPHHHVAFPPNPIRLPGLRGLVLSARNKVRPATCISNVIAALTCDRVLLASGCRSIHAVSALNALNCNSRSCTAIACKSDSTLTELRSSTCAHNNGSCLARAQGLESISAPPTARWRSLTGGGSPVCYSSPRRHSKLALHPLS